MWEFTKFLHDDRGNCFIPFKPENQRMKVRLFIIFIIAVVSLAVPLLFDSAVLQMTTIIATICLTLWLSEIVPVFVPTFLLLTLTPLLLAPLDKKFALPVVLGWASDPVLALFFGGFVLGLAARRFGLDRRLADLVLRTAGNSFAALLLLVILITAFLSMWMSNIAAAALMLAALRPVLAKFGSGDHLRRALLTGIAFGADLGGISTPIGTGPNAIAVAAVSAAHQVSFIGWMIFALPLAAGMLCLCFGIIWLHIRDRKSEWSNHAERFSEKSISGEGRPPLERNERIFLLVFAATIILWLAEPLHAVSAGVVSLAAASVLFLSGMLKKDDLRDIDWSTLLLIAGGIALGKLLEQSELVKVIAGNVPWERLDPSLALFLLCLASAVLSALMSNTATAVLLIPLAQALMPSPSTAILVAIAASFGIPFVISTPPNAMVYGEGGMKAKDLLLPGIIIMILGCLLISLTGRPVLRFMGIFSESFYFNFALPVSTKKL